MQTLLLLTGGAIALYCLWQFRRWLGEPQETGPAGIQRLETLVDELVATAEATSAVVQEKAEALAGLIAEADRRIGALSAGDAGAGAGSAGRAAAGRPEPAVQAEMRPQAAVPTTDAQPTEVRRAEVRREPAVGPDLPATASAAPAGAKAEVVPANAAVGAPAPAQPAAEQPGTQVPDLHRQVYALADAGNDLTAIARRLGLTKGEVQLILGLRK